jgi:hypothetical protein
VPRLTRTRQNGNYTLTEQGITKYTDLNMAQTLALASVAEALAATVRAEANNRQSQYDIEEAKSNYDDKQ